MKITKIFGCVLGFHLCIIAVLLVQPGCQSSQPPTQTHTQNRTQSVTQNRTQSVTPTRTVPTSVQGAQRVKSDLIPAERVDGLDSAFNAGLEADPMVNEPFAANDPIDSIEPLEPILPLQTAEVPGMGSQSYTVKKGDSLWSISRRYNVTLNELYAANGLNQNSVLKVGQLIQIPVSGGAFSGDPASPVAVPQSGYDQATTSYTVQRGDTLSRIAQSYNTTVGAIKAANSKSSDVIRVGETLIVPVASGRNPAPSASSNQSMVVPASTTTVSSLSGPTRTHKVRAGEYPAKIAQQYGMTTSELLAVNGITDPRKLRVGQELIVRGSGSAASVDSPVQPASPPTVTTPPTTPSSTLPQTVTRAEPVEIRVVEADPVLEGEFNPPASDDLFENAVEVPIIRLQE